ncbi:DUF2244 domain-containing protein [Paracoccus saliphilus]|uniref:DUF2244 domain-containing protein n=1 Tax=Paracoccus saliphilus TaxID=405559 RepID=A0AA45W3I4_9RHOB|nr:DUF2244 domain-containing protein [Paracoccus saliphilus]WCR02521.1 DUF2244 domain-containing protein [Paracoccus saliphilus]SIS76839.1 Uncharacterized membrane protein [Paracoccus saliphilus]
MPYEWQDTAPEDSGAVSHRLVLWPYRSLPRRGFVWFIGATAALMALPLAALLGTSALWGLLPFALVAIWAIWTALQRSYRSGEIREELRLNRDMLELWRHDPGRADRQWQTNPYWVRVSLWDDGPVEEYLTLTDGRREIELGAFLTPEERRELCNEINRQLARLR